jgi:hypothetical protein
MGQPAGIRTVIRLLQTALGLPRRRVGHVHAVGRLHQSIDEPVPVGGRRHDHALEGGVLRSSWR